MGRIVLKDTSGVSHECTLAFSEGLPLVVALQLPKEVELLLHLDVEQLKQELSRWSSGTKVS